MHLGLYLQNTQRIKGVARLQLDLVWRQVYYFKFLDQQVQLHTLTENLQHIRPYVNIMYLKSPAKKKCGLPCFPLSLLDRGQWSA